MSDKTSLKICKRSSIGRPVRVGDLDAPWDGGEWCVSVISTILSVIEELDLTDAILSDGRSRSRDVLVYRVRWEEVVDMIGMK